GTIPMAEFAARANEETMVGIQIETAQAVVVVEEIAAIDGVDFLFVGPSDLSQAMGVIGDFLHPRCIEAVDRIADASRRAGKQWGAVMPTPDYAALLIDKGCTLISVTNDVKLITSGLEATKDRFSFLWE
ncbi:MAG: aldolase/citrate lyase family protein, partial [Acidimicrobiales bacterium]